MQLTKAMVLNYIYLQMMIIKSVVMVVHLHVSGVLLPQHFSQDPSRPSVRDAASTVVDTL